jgi:hypothetical protein
VNEDFQYRSELVTEFQMLGCVQRRPDRDTLVDELERELGHPLHFVRSDEIMYDLWGLLTACLASPIPDALGRLVEIARVFEKDTRPMIRLRALVGSVLPTIPPLDQPGLGRVLESVSPTDLRAATRDASGPLGPPTDVALSDQLGLVRALSSAAAMPGAPPPLLVFLVRLADRIPDSLAAELAGWISRIAGELGLTAGDLDRIRTGPGAGPPTPQRSFVVVELREDGPQPDRYLMSIWLQHDDGSGRALYVNDDRPTPLNELPARLDAVLQALTRSSLEEIGDVTVEFVLPWDLLGHGVDQWPVALTGLRHEIGVDYPVVVRSLDRIRNPMVRARWLRRWRHMLAFGGAARAELVQWLQWRQADHTANHTPVFSHSDEWPVCLIVSFAAEAGPLPTAVVAGLGAGMPVMLWCRDARGAAQFEADIPQQMYARPLLDLPALVLRLRQEAARHGPVPDHLGRHLSLLWDDPDRLPPENPLAAPAPA